MVNEALLRLEVSLPSSMACDDGASFVRGALLQLIDANKVSGTATARNVPFGGFVNTEKISGSGTTQVAVHRAQGTIIDVVNASSLSGSSFVAKGQLIKISGNNTVSAISGTSADDATFGELSISQSLLLGLAFAKAKEDATGTEVFQVELL